MEDVLIKIAGFIVIIAFGYLARLRGLLKRSDATVLGAIVMNVTLPCSLVAGMNGSELDPAIAIVFVLGTVSSIALIAAGYFRARRLDKRGRVLEMINTGGYNMGNFAIPFATSFFPGAVLPYLCIFDAGGAVMTLGGTFSIARSILSGDAHFSVRSFLKVLFSSIAFDTYLVLIVLCMVHIELPAPVVSIASMIGGANAFLAMFMVGVMLDLHFDRAAMGSIFRIMTTRYALTGAFALLSYLYLPFPEIARQAIAVALVSPLANMDAIYSVQLDLDKRVPAVAMTVSILISTALMSALVLFFLA